MSVMWVIVLHLYTKFEVSRPSHSEDMADFRSRHGLVTLTFAISTSKWGHGSPVSWASFLSISGFLCPSVLDLRSDTGQRD